LLDDLADGDADIIELRQNTLVHTPFPFTGKILDGFQKFAMGAGAKGSK
jgi:hypothetical protein